MGKDFGQNLLYKQFFKVGQNFVGQGNNFENHKKNRFNLFHLVEQLAIVQKPE